MALLTNINGKFSVSDAGAVRFNDAFTFPTADGDANYVLQTNGSGQISWAVNGSGDISGSGTVNKVTKFTGTKTIGDGPITFSNASATATSTFGGPVTSASVYGTSRVQSDDNMYMVGGQFYIGASDGTTDDTYRFYAASGVYYLQSRKSGTWTTYLSIGSDAHAAFSGQVSATHFDSTSTTANIFLGSVITKPGDNLGFIVRNTTNAIIGSLLRTSNTTSKLTTDNLSLGGTTAQYVRGDGSFATYSPGTGTVTGSGAANRVTYWDSTTNVTSDAGFTYNGFGRVTTDESFNVSKNGADTAADGPFFGLKNAAETRQYINQLDASNNIDYWYYNGSTWTQTISLLTDGGATFAGSVKTQNTSANAYPYFAIEASAKEYHIGVGGASAVTGYANNLYFYDNTAAAIRMVIDTSGKVGIGTDSPSSYDGESDNLVVASGVDGAVPTPGITIACLGDTAATGRGALRFADGTSSNAPYRGALEYNHNGDDMFFRTSGTIKMTLDDGGNLGIGTTSPDALLVVQADAHNEAFAGKRSATEYLWFLRNESNSGRFQLYNSSSSQTIEMTGANGRITAAQGLFGTAFALSNGGFATLGSTSSSVPIAIAIDGDASTASIVVPTNKNVCIGGVYNYTGTGVTSLNINGTDYPLLAFYSGSTLRTALISYSNNTAFYHAMSSAKWQFENGTGIMGELSGSGTLTVKSDVVAYGSPSDKRLKENIKPIESALDKVSKLQGVTFDWKESDTILNIKEDIGFIAQDVQKVIPELVRENEDGMLSMRHQGIAPILLEAIKELKAEIEELKFNKCNCK